MAETNTRLKRVTFTKYDLEFIDGGKSLSEVWNKLDDLGEELLDLTTNYDGEVANSGYESLKIAVLGLMRDYQKVSNDRNRLGLRNARIDNIMKRKDKTNDEKIERLIEVLGE